jgi:hypothetical protein
MVVGEYSVGKRSFEFVFTLVIRAPYSLIFSHYETVFLDFDRRVCF